MVAPLVGARIEISPRYGSGMGIQSLPSWERGLKSYSLKLVIINVKVAPLVGARIEITMVVFVV